MENQRLSNRTLSGFNVEKSPSDPRNYRFLTLPNGLQALLVEQPNAEQAAASMTVKAGHFQDPEDTPGLAHFLEHMLFLGSDQFPEEDEYSNFMSFAGGHHNAWTGTEHSNFYFEVPTEHFKQALVRFSRILIAPKLDTAWVDRERQAIESEYRMKLKDELRRLYDIHKQTSNPQHPFAKFSVGNATTLADNKTESITAKLARFHDAYYWAGNMALTLVSSFSLDEQEYWVSTFFKALKSEGVLPAEPTTPLYLDTNLSQWIYVKPLKDANRLLLTFSLPEINSDYPYKTTSYIAHLLGYEGEHSLCSALRQQCWILNLSAGGGASGSNFKDFTINIQLTDKGRDEIEQIVQWTFAYIRLIEQHGLDEALYQDRAAIVALAYQFPEPSRPVDLASQLSINMLHYEPAHVISGDFIMRGLNQSFARDILAQMVPEKVRITVINNHVITDQESRWYQAEFSCRALKKRELELFKSRPTMQFQLAPKNPFIPERHESLPLQHPLARYPQQQRIHPAFDYWHLQDPDFRVPKGHLYLMLKMPYAAASARNYACSRIWCELGLETLSEKFYDAEIAGININLFPQHGGITLHLSGFSCRQPEVFKAIVKALSAVEVDESAFNNIKGVLSNNWNSVHQTNPINHMVALLHHHLQQGSYTSKQLAESVLDVDFEHYQHLLPGLFRDAQATLLVHGDWPPETAREMALFAADVLPITETPAAQLSRYVRRLSPGVESITFPSSHPDHIGAFFIQGSSTDLKEKACFLLLNHLTGPFFFNELRTRQQLGYLVGNSYIPMHGLPGILFYVQSPSVKPTTLLERIHEFLAEFAEQVLEIGESDWKNATTAVAGHLENQDPSLRIRAQRLWQSITKNQANFQLAAELATEVRSLSREYFLEKVEKHLKNECAGMELSTLALTENQ